jgi:hypothetical protein
MTLQTALRIVAVFVATAGTIECLVLDEFIAAPFFVAIILGAVSFAPHEWERGIARALLVVSVAIPIGAVAAYARGLLPIGVPIFDTLVFGWLFTRAYPRARMPR